MKLLPDKESEIMFGYYQGFPAGSSDDDERLEHELPVYAYSQKTGKPGIELVVQTSSVK